MQKISLGRTGLEVSRLSYGASSLGGVFGAVDDSEAEQVVHTALDLGINLIDVAPFYGLTKAETVLGRILRALPRDRFLLSTKVGRYGHTEFDYSPERIARGLDESLQRLHTDYVDLLVCHDIEFGSLDQIVQETIPAMRRLQAQGKARFLGISGLPLRIFTEVLRQTDLDFILSYCRYTLFDTGLNALLPLVQEKQIGLINAAPLSMGLLSERAPDWHPASAEIKEACVRAAAHCRERGVDIAQLAIQFATAAPQIDTTLVGSPSAGQMRRNVAWMNTPIDTGLLAEVQAILAPIRDQTWPSGRHENNDPITLPAG